MTHLLDNRKIRQTWFQIMKRPASFSLLSLISALEVMAAGSQSPSPLLPRPTGSLLATRKGPATQLPIKYFSSRRMFNFLMGIDHTIALYIYSSFLFLQLHDTLLCTVVHYTSFLLHMGWFPSFFFFFFVNNTVSFCVFTRLFFGTESLK